jgi:hypothetical protein
MIGGDENVLFKISKMLSTVTVQWMLNHTMITISRTRLFIKPLLLHADSQCDVKIKHKKQMADMLSTLSLFQHN